MKCSNCYADNAPNSSFCNSCGAKLQSLAISTAAILPIPTYITQAILVTFLCFLPLGIVAFINASKADNYLKAGIYELAKEYSDKARKWTVITFWIGISLKLLLFLVFFKYMDHVFKLSDYYTFMVWGLIIF